MASFIGVEMRNVQTLNAIFISLPSLSHIYTNLHNIFILIAILQNESVSRVRGLQWLLANWLAFCYNVDMQFPFAA
jgi:hypothetical protein